MLCRPPGRYDSNHVVSLGIGHIKNVTINHAYYYEPLFTVIPPVVKKLDGKCIFKDTFCEGKRYAVLTVIALCLSLVPLKFQTHRVLDISSSVKGHTPPHKAGALRAFDGQRHGIATAEAQRGHAALRVAPGHLVEQRHEDARAGGSDGMA